jgi:GrpB-like predicted nucleotidyltransferase (UPF0157 family)
LQVLKPREGVELRAPISSWGDIPSPAAKSFKVFSTELFAWPSLFEQEADRVRDALDNRVLRIEHVGSTSVQGLAAKPIIDILLVVADTADEAGYVQDLEAAGYVLRIREPGWYEHRMFKGPGTDINLHCFSDGCPEVQRMLAFRDWLRVNEDDRLLYERTKRELATKIWRYAQSYADAKTAIVEEILARATGAG